MHMRAGMRATRSGRLNRFSSRVLSFNDIFVNGTPIVVIVQCVASRAALRQKPASQEIHLAPNTTELNRESHC
jgi:hypothetical protein